MSTVVTSEEIRRMKELEAILKDYRETLAPKLEKISQAFSALTIWGDIEGLMEFEGSKKFKTEATVDLAVGDKTEKVLYKITIEKK